MRVEEIRALDDTQLAQELEDAHRELFNLRFRHASRQLEDPNQLRSMRKTIARIKTIMSERNTAEGDD